jgi:cell division septation protein DedD
MDRRFKERLIGAAVLAGAAVLILPAVLNGPHAPLPEPAAPGETAMRTETIELERASGSRGEPATKPPTASSRATSGSARSVQCRRFRERASSRTGATCAWCRSSDVRRAAAR